MSLTISLFVQQNLWVPLSNFGLVAPTITACLVVILATIFYASKKTKRMPLPPMAKHGTFTVIKELQTAYAPQHVLRYSRELQSQVFRLPLPEWKPMVIVASPSLARTILEGDKTKSIPESDKSNHYASFQRLFDKGKSFLFLKTKEEQWKKGRKGVAPAFSASNIARQVPRMVKGINQFHDILSQHAADGKSLDDLGTWMLKLIFDILGSGMFQIEFNLLTGGETDEVKEFSDELHHCNREFFKMQFFDPLRKFYFWNQNVRRAEIGAKVLMKFGASIMDKYNEIPEAERDSTSILGHIVRLHETTASDHKDKVANVVSMLMAGHETTSNQLTWIIVEITRRPEVLLLIQAELDQAFPYYEDILDADKLLKADLKYLNRVINEAMRVNPVVAGGILREVGSDIEHEGMLIPKGSTAIIHYYSLFRSSISQPDEFLPDRWDEAHPEYPLLKSLFVPFSLGKRNCMGMNLALLEIKIVLASLFRSFDVTLQNSDKPVDSDYFLSMKAVGVNVNVTKRIN